MPFEWLQTPLDAPVSELFARGRRTRAIEQIRKQLLGQIAPSVELRLELVDLLAAAGRLAEAVPVLLGLADEFARDGFVAKAVAALKRVEKLEPGRADVEARLGRLVHQQQEAAPLVGADSPPTVVAELEPTAEPEFDKDLETPGAAEASAAAPALSESELDRKLLDLAQDVVQRTPPPSAERQRLVAYAERLLACDLFASVPEEELLAIVRALKLRIVEPGEVILAEGERGEGLFVIATGGVKVFIANPSGRDVPVAGLGEGEYFGEIASLSGHPRTATVTAGARCELLELDAALLRDVTSRHPAMEKRLEEVYVERVSSPEAAAVRTVPLADAGGRARAAQALRRHFGEGRWEPRVRLKLAEVLARTEKAEEAQAVLSVLADDLLREGFPDKAVAILKKIEGLRSRDVERVSLAPLPVLDLLARSAPAAAAPARPLPHDAAFQSWLLDILRERAKRTIVRAPSPAAPEEPPAPLPAPDFGAIRVYEPGLKASPLLEGLEEAERLALLQGLKLVVAQPGDILVSQGEAGDSLYILVTGAVRVYARGAEGRAVPVCVLGEGAFFGEMAAISGQPRSATIVAATPAELLELDRSTLDAIGARHPRVHRVLEEYCVSRGATLPQEAE
ncbi:MAG TPA: cyclic nucleotide-binding domain-containing protein [Vicinamibacteria bacterium]|nr:cyclic nucleotide-binding domain-containing protein [Vicinamibacteria bacterium]